MGNPLSGHTSRGNPSLYVRRNRRLKRLRTGDIETRGKSSFSRRSSTGHIVSAFAERCSRCPRGALIPGQRLIRHWLKPRIILAVSSGLNIFRLASFRSSVIVFPVKGLLIILKLFGKLLAERFLGHLRRKGKSRMVPFLIMLPKIC